MVCSICGSSNCEMIYNDKIRRGSFGHMTKEKIPVYHCKECDVIWHGNVNEDMEGYYSSEEYRNEIDESGIEDYYQNHDFETLEKLNYTGTAIYRHKRIADIGCGGGSFLDFAGRGIAEETIAIEPTEMFHKELEKKGHKVFSYMTDAKKEYEGALDVITSFDVIEHVESPLAFMKEQRSLLKKGGKVINGTPSSAVVMRQALGKEYEEFLFSYQHPWILSEESLRIIAKEAGFKNIRVEYKQRYGLGNLISWLRNHRPEGHTSYDYISEGVEEIWKRELERKGIADYLVIYAEAE